MKRPGLSALGIILDMLPDPKDLAAAAVLSFAVALFLFLAEAASVAVLVWRIG